MRLPPGPSQKHGFLALAVAAIYFALAMFGASNKSGTFDEFAHVTGGYSYWTLNDYRVQPENGNWAQRIVALPAVASDTRFPSLDQPAWERSDFWAISDQFFFGGANDADALLRRARMVVALVGAALCLLVFFWSRRLWGYTGAWVTLILFAFSPTVLAHGGLATSDIIATAFFVGAAWSLWTVLHRVTPLTVATSVLTTAGLFLSKYSAVVLIPIVISMLVVRLVAARPLIIHFGRREARTLSRQGQKAGALSALTAFHVLAVVTIIWASYGFRYSAFNPNAGSGSQFIDPWSEVVDSSVTSSAIQWGRRHEVMPEAYLYGFSTVLVYSKNRAAFANGESREGGWWWFFPYAAFAKATLPMLLLVAIVPLLLLFRRRGPQDPADIPPPLPVYEATPLLLLIGWYWAFAIISHLNIGQRHLLPVIAATAILLGAAGEPISRLRRLMTTGARNA
jgi:hypothetical protein